MTKLGMHILGSTRRQRLLVLSLVALVALVARLDYALRDPLIQARHDMQDFHDVIGVNLVTGHGFSYQVGLTTPTVARAPLFPAVLGATYVMAGDRRSWRLWRVLDAAVDTGSAVLLVLLVLQATALQPRHRALARQDPGRDDHAEWTPGPVTEGSLWVAGIAGFGYALHPLTIRYTALLTPETWLTFWTVLAALAFVGWLRRPTKRRAALTGVTLGLLMLTKSVGLGLPVMAIIGGALLLRRSVSRQTILVCATVIVIASYGLIAPWTIRNYAVSHSFIPVQTLTWYNFWVDWTMDDPPPPVDPFPLKVEPYPGPAHLMTPEQDVYREAWLRDRALEWTWHHPLAFCGKMASNLLQFWYYSPGAPNQLTKVELAYLLQLALAVAGAAVGLTRRRLRLLTVLCLAVSAYFVLLYAPFSVIVRYSLVTLPFTVALSAIAVVALAAPLWRAVARRVPVLKRAPTPRL